LVTRTIIKLEGTAKRRRVHLDRNLSAVCEPATMYLRQRCCSDGFLLKEGKAVRPRRDTRAQVCEEEDACVKEKERELTSD
jgi:hypothetical protein